jgi:hypothetical protein
MSAMEPFDDEAAIHEGFAKRKLGLQQDPDLRLRVEKSGGHWDAGSIAAGESCSTGRGECDRSAANKLAQKTT